MIRPIFPRIAPIAFVALFSLGIYACQDSTAPGIGTGHFVDFVVNPVFQTDAARQAVPIRKVRGIVHRSNGTVALDTIVDYTAVTAQPASRLDLAALTAPPTIRFHVELTSSSPTTGEDFTIDLEVLDAAGNVLFRGGPVSVHAAVGQTPPPIDIAELYTGPGSTASSISVTPTTATLLSGAAVDIVGRATDGTGAAVSNAPILWTSLDPTIASVPNPLVGHIIGAARGSARIRAALVTGQTADALLTVNPVAASISIQSGNAQTGAVGTALPQPLVVKALATDGLALAGVVINFAIQSGGGALTLPQVTTGSDGLASVGYTLGSTPGTVTITASAAGLTGSPLTFTVTGTAGPASQIVFTTQPAGALAGITLAPVVVELRDQLGNRATSFSGQVTLALLTAPTGVQLQGTLSATAVGGVATFANLSVSAAAPSLQLVASATGVASTGTSTTFAIGPRTAVSLAFTTQPANVPADDPMGTIVVQARDALGALASSYTGLVTINIDAPPAGVALYGTLTATAVGGVATFSNLSVSPQAGTIRLVATGSGIAGSFFSNTFVVGPPTNPLVANPTSAVFTVQRTAASPAAIAVQLTSSAAQITGMAVGTIVYGPGATGWLSAGLSANSTPSTLTVTPTTGALPAGSFTATVPITGAGGFTATYAVTLTVTPLPVTQLAVITDPAGATSGLTFVTQPVIELRDATGTRVQSASNAVTASISVGSGVLSGTVTRTPVLGRVTYTDLRITGTGAHTLAYSATGLAGATSVSFNVGAALSTTQAVPSTTGTSGTLIPAFTPVTASGGTLPYAFALSGGVLPTGMSFNTATGLVSGTPSTALATTTFTVTVTDGVGTVSSKTFALTVNAGLTTTQAIPSKVGDVGTAIASFVPVTASGGTAPITYALTPLATLTGIGMAFDVSTGAVSGTPSGTLAVTTFTVTATDNLGANSSKTFTLTVNAALTTTQAVPAQVGNNGTAIPSFIPVTAAGGTAPITFAISPAATLTGVGLAFNTGTGAVSGTPTGTLALTTFTVTATDNIGATSAKTFTLTVNAALTTTQAVPATTGTQGTLIPAFTPVTASGGTAPITFAVSPLATLTGIGLAFNTGTGAVSGTPTGPLALTTFTVTATDNIGATSAKTFTLTVNGPLTTTQAIPAKVGTQGAAIASFIPVTAAGGSAPITYAISPAATLTGIGLVFNTGTGAVSGTPTGALAITTFTVTATDNIGATSFKTFTLTVNAALTTTQAVPSTTGTSGALLPTFTPVTAANGTAPITLAVTPLATLTGIGLAFDVNTGAVSGTPSGALALTTFTVTATDAAGATSSKTFTLTVNGGVTTTQAVPSKVGDVGVAIASFIPVTAAGGTAPITFAVSPLATLTGIGMAFNTGTGAVSGTPSGTLALTTFTVTATDALGANSSKTFTLTVNAALTTTQAVPAQVGNNGTAIPSFIPVTAAGGTAPITFAISPAATLTGVGLAFNTGTGAVSGTPTGTLAITTFTVTATDNIGATSAKTFTLTVNAALTTTQAVPATVGTQGTLIPTFTPVTASGGTAPITYAVSPLATLTGIGLAFNTGTGAVSGTPSGPLTITTFTVTATDNIGATSSKTFTLTVNGPLTTTQAIAAKVGTQGAAIASFIPVTAAGGTAPITLAISPAATLTGIGLAFNTSTGAVSGTPTGALAITTFTVTATDGIGATSFKTFTLTVNAALTTTQAVPSTTGTSGAVLPTFTPVTAANGTAPITFAVTPLATLTGIGLAFDVNTGAVSGTPSGALALTTFTVTATDAAGATSSKTFTLTVNAGVTTTQVIPSKVGDVGVAIASFIPVTASGGTAPITFGISPAATLTGIGMAFDVSTGAVSGTPSGPLSLTTFTVTATDALGANSSKTFTLTVNTALTTTQAVPAKVGDNGTAIPSFVPVTATGGTAPITYAISPAATLTGIGLAFNTGTGAVSGTPTGTLAITTFTVTATDNIGATSSKTFTLTVNATLATTQAVPATVGTQGILIPTFTPVTASGGTAPITFALTPLATLTGIGMAFDVNTGAVSGTPSGPLSITTFTVTATDNIGATSFKTFTLTVNGPLTTTQAVPSTVAQIGNAVTSFTPVTAAGGTAPYTFAITSGTLPTGMSINAGTGAVSGTPTTMLALTTFTVTVTDFTAATSTKTFDLTVNGIVLNVTAAPTGSVTAGADISIPLLIDMSNRGTDDLASITVNVTWDPTRFTYKSSAAGTWPGGVVTPNPADVATGTFRLGGFAASGVTADFTLYTIVLTANATTGASPVSASIAAAGKESGTAIIVTPRNVSVTINP